MQTRNSGTDLGYLARTNIHVFRAKTFFNASTKKTTRLKIFCKVLNYITERKAYEFVRAAQMHAFN